MIDKAVILAAGQGNRIARASQTPKPFLSLDGTPDGPCFLDWHIEQLAAIGVREIFLVGNQVTSKRPFKGPRGCRVHWILNPTEDLSTSGSGHSFWFALHSEHEILDGHARVVMMDADILYEAGVLHALGAPSRDGRSRTLVCGDYRESNEEVMVFGKDNRALTHGKGLLDTSAGKSLLPGMSCYGEATGMVLWEPGDHGLVRAATDWCIKYSTAKARSEHEDITQRMMLADRVSPSVFHELMFMECDSPEEYAVLTGDFFPKLRANQN